MPRTKKADVGEHPFGKCSLTSAYSLTSLSAASIKEAPRCYPSSRPTFSPVGGDASRRVSTNAFILVPHPAIAMVLLLLFWIWYHGVLDCQGNSRESEPEKRSYPAHSVCRRSSGTRSVPDTLVLKHRKTGSNTADFAEIPGNDGKSAHTRRAV